MSAGTPDILPFVWCWLLNLFHPFYHTDKGRWSVLEAHAKHKHGVLFIVYSCCYLSLFVLTSALFTDPFTAELMIYCKGFNTNRISRFICDERLSLIMLFRFSSLCQFSFNFSFICLYSWEIWLTVCRHFWLPLQTFLYCVLWLCCVHSAKSGYNFCFIFKLALDGHYVDKRNA